MQEPEDLTSPFRRSLLPGTVLDRPNRIGEAHLLRNRGAAAFCWFSCGDPAGEPDQLEGRGNATIGIGEAFGIDLRGAQQSARVSRACGGGPAACSSCPCAAGPASKREGVVIAHAQGLEIGDG